MSSGGWWYVGVFLASGVLALVLTPLAVRVALARQVLDRPGGHKSHASPVPYLGGAAMACSFAGAVMLAALVRPPHSGLDELIGILGFAVGLCIVGLIDDLRGLNVFIRLGLEVAAGVALWAIGVRVEVFANDALSGVLTVLWVVGITNAFNLLDNMDGLSAGVAGIAAASFFCIAALNGQFLVAGLSAAVAGCALGFLRSNFHPARIYMGDAGSLFLGFLLAVIGVKLRFDGPTEVTFMVPILVLGVALFDTTLVTATRLLNHRSPLSGGRDHTSHRLVFVGIPVPAAVCLIYVAAASLGWLGIVVSRVDRGSGYLLLGLVLTIAVIIGVLLALVPVYETSRRRRLMIRAVEPADPDLAESVQP